MELLKKYYREGLFDDEPFGELRPDGRDREIVKENFSKLIRKHNIEASKSDLFELLCVFSYDWDLVDFRLNFAESSDDALDQYQLLTELLISGKFCEISRIEFGAQGSLGCITNKHVIANILDRTNRYKLGKDMRIGKKDIIEDYDPSQRLQANQVKRKFIKSFMMPLFEYLKNETSLGEGSENDIYRFIKEFCCLAGVEWEAFSTQEDPAVYLKKTFSLIRNAK